MIIMIEKIYRELRWYAGREGNFTTIFANDNDYEYYHEGKVQITRRKIRKNGEVIDILLEKGECCKGSTLETSQLKDYNVDYREVRENIIHKILTIYLKDGSLVMLAAECMDKGDQRETDVELSDEYIRYLFGL